MKTFTITELQEFLVGRGLPEEIWDQIQAWFERGDGIAIFENAELGHPDLGHLRFASFGSAEAQFETDEPPIRLPDFPGEINWRYVLRGTYRPEKVTS